MSDNDVYNQTIDAAVASIRLKVAAVPRVLVICGSGLGGLVDMLEGDRVEIAYGDIPGFKQLTVPGHAGRLVFGTIGSNLVPVMCMVGRLHAYEGYELRDTTFPVRVAAVLGVETLVVTNAAGGINPSYKPGDLMVINDHINFPGLAGFHPLRGENLERFGPRFQPLSDAYDLALRQQVFALAKEVIARGRKVHEGVYIYYAGPTFETRAEVRLARAVGADAVGMSTVPEVIVARHSGLRVLAMLLITNAGVGDPPASALDPNPVALDKGMALHAEVLEEAAKAALDVQAIFRDTINSM